MQSSFNKVIVLSLACIHMLISIMCVYDMFDDPCEKQKKKLQLDE